MLLNFLVAFEANQGVTLDGDNEYTDNDICKMIEVLVDNIYARFGGQLFRQMVGIPKGTNCAPLLADLFLYSYENDFLDKVIKEGERKLAPKEFTISETTESTSVVFISICFPPEIRATT